MGVKLIITETQLKKLTQHLNESVAHEAKVEELVKDLNLNYEPMIGIVREEGEYFEKPMIKIKVDEEEISPKQLFEYFRDKYEAGDEFIKQVIKDWMFGTLKGNRLSKNVPLN